MLKTIRARDNVRGFIIGSDQTAKRLEKSLGKLVNQFSKDETTTYDHMSLPKITERLKNRYADVDSPLYVGLINENTRQGVHINTAPSASYYDHDSETLLDFLAARLYGGGGAHSMFMKTWAAGLAYSNGLRSDEFTGQLRYYAERCPDLVQTMQFVVNELEKAPFDEKLAEYAVAQAFTSVRSGNRYDSRGIAMAADLADGLTPDKVKEFRENVLKLSEREDLYDELHRRMLNSYGKILPGYGKTGNQSEDSNYFLIGPESQMGPYEDYLRSVEGDITLYRLYPRDFWLMP